MQLQCIPVRLSVDRIRDGEVGVGWGWGREILPSQRQGLPTRYRGGLHPGWADTRSRSSIWSRGPELPRPKVAHAAERSCASKASYLWRGSRAFLRALGAFDYLTLKYAFSHILETLSLSFLTFTSRQKKLTIFMKWETIYWVKRGWKILEF